MPPGHRPTVRGRRLAAELRTLRERAQLTCEQVARRLGTSPATISRMENARVRIPDQTLHGLLDLYEVPQSEWDLLLRLAKDAAQKGWWLAYGDVLPKWFEGYVALEAEASVIRNFQLALIPGLLQSPDYARALLERNPRPESPEEIERIVQVRMERQKLLRRNEAERLPRFEAVLDESALRRPVGGPAVLRAQVEYLVRLAQQDNVSVQVLPYSAGAHEGLDGAFSVLEFADPTTPKVVYLDTLTGGFHLEKTYEIGRYGVAFRKLQERALRPDESIRCMKGIVLELSH
jgi:transcriptional regulator with XRE-family HTH domain